jgi:chromosome segregation ATPase
VDAVRQLVAWPSVDCGKCTTLRGDLLRACGLEMDDTEDGEGWDMAAAAAIQAIAEIEYFYRREAARFLVVLEDEQRKQAVIRNDTARLYEEKINRANAAFLHTVGELKDEITRLNGQTHSESEQVSALRDDLARSTGVIEQLREQVDILQGVTRWESEDTTRLRDELTRTGSEVEQLRDRLQTSESRLIWYREALRVLRDRVGLAHLDEDEDVVERMLESIASMTYAVARHQDLASAAEARADHLEGELERQIGANEAQAAVERELRATIAEQSADFERLRNQDLAANGRDWSTDDSPLLDVALAVLSEEPVPADRIATLIDLARRASA